MKQSWLPAGNFCSVKITRLLFVPLCLIGFALFFSCPAKADTYYVSKTATGSVHDGLSWQTAFNELNQLPDKLFSGDVVEVDGGASSMRYDTPLTIHSRKSDLHYGMGPIVVKTSSAPGRNGQVQIVGNGTGIGIDIDMPYHCPDVHVVGRTWRSFRVLNYGIGAYVTGFANLSNVQLDNNKECGLVARGYWHTFNQLVINDNPLNVHQRHDFLYDPGIYLTRCWIFNSDANAYRSDGIMMENGGPTIRRATLKGCVMGPGLRNAFVDRGGLDAFYEELSLTNCLLINPSDGNFNTNKVKIELKNVTSFLTPLNPSGKGHSCLQAYSDDTLVSNSVFYGGAVVSMSKGSSFTQAQQAAAKQVGFRRFGAGNLQFRTSGNTLVLSPNQTNPQFATNVAAIGSGAMPTQLYGLNLSHSVAPASGSQLLSIGQLLSKNYP